MTWKDKPDYSRQEYYLSLIWVDEYNKESNHWWMQAGVRWDGCINLHIANNLPFEINDEQEEKGRLVEYLHICDIDDMILKLQLLKQKSLEHFGNGWPE